MSSIFFNDPVAPPSQKYSIVEDETERFILSFPLTRRRQPSNSSETQKDRDRNHFSVFSHSKNRFHFCHFEA